MWNFLVFDSCEGGGVSERLPESLPLFAGIVAVFAADLECATCVDGSDAGIFRAFGADEGAEGIAGAIAEIVAVFAADLGMC